MSHTAGYIPRGSQHYEPATLDWRQKAKLNAVCWAVANRRGGSELTILTLQVATAGAWQRPVACAQMARTCRVFRSLFNERIVRNIRSHNALAAVGAHSSEYALLHMPEAPSDD